MLAGAIEGVDPYPLGARRSDPALGQRVYTNGHPHGGAVSHSMNDNRLLDDDGRHLHYSSPAEPSSDGSPMFNHQWELIGIHHAFSPSMPRLHGAAGSYSACDGISIQAIREQLALRHQ